MKLQSPQIVYEEENFFVVNKPPGYYSHPAYQGQKVKSLVDYFADKMEVFIPKRTNDCDYQIDSEGYHKESNSNIPPFRKGLVHRLDRDTSGLLIMAKNLKAFQAFKDLFSQRKVVKGYRALVHSHFFEHSKYLTHKLIRDPHHRTRRKVISDNSPSRHPNPKSKIEPMIEKNYKIAETEVTPITFFKNHTFLEIKIFTGRTHQIRVQLTHEGHPIVGDRLYGSRNRKEPSFLMLCAYYLEFTNPFTGKRVSFDTKLPDYFFHYMERLERYHLEIKKRG